MTKLNVKAPIHYNIAGKKTQAWIGDWRKTRKTPEAGESGPGFGLKLSGKLDGIQRFFAVLGGENID